MLVRRFTLILGILLVGAGILGFIPSAVIFHDNVDHSFGYLLGLFPVNAVHNLVHIALGIWAIGSSGDYSKARKFNQANAVIYGMLALFGIIPGLNTMFGLVPLFGHDIWLHAGVALLSAYFGYSIVESRALRTEQPLEEAKRTGTDF